MYRSIFIRDHFVYAPSQWETTLHGNVVSHWLGAYTKWSLINPYNFCLQVLSAPSPIDAIWMDEHASPTAPQASDVPDWESYHWVESMPPTTPIAIITSMFYHQFTPVYRAHRTTNKLFFYTCKEVVIAFTMQSYAVPRWKYVVY